MLKVTADKVYDVCLKQAQFELIWNKVIVVGWVLLFAVMLVVTCYTYKKARSNQYSEWDVGFTLSLIATITIAIAGLLFIGQSIYEILQIKYSPDIWIFRYITDLVK